MGKWVANIHTHIHEYDEHKRAANFITTSDRYGDVDVISRCNISYMWSHMYEIHFQPESKIYSRGTKQKRKKNDSKNVIS